MVILASDYDGTLNQGGISQENRDAILRFREAGNLFGIVTGRDWRMYEVMQRNDLSLDFILAMNGAMLISTTGETSGQPVWCDRQRNNGCIRWIAEHVGKNYGHDLGCTVEQSHFCFHWQYPEGNDQFVPFALTDQNFPGGVKEFSQLNTRCDTEELAARCVAEINSRWGDTVHALQNGTCIDIPPAGVDKGSGLARYAAYMHVPEENVFCAGDHMNDYAMIARFHGLAVENAVPALKAAAEAVFPDIAGMIDFLLRDPRAGRL